MMTYFCVVFKVPWGIQVPVSKGPRRIRTQRGCLGKGVICGHPMLVVADAVGTGEVTLGEYQAGEHST